MLSWTAGEFAATHDVYLGTSFDDVNNAGRANPMDVLVSQDQEDTTFEPGRIEFDTTYFWRVDEGNAAPDYTIFKGVVWQFTTEPYSYPLSGDKITATASSFQGVMMPEKTIDGSGLNASDQHSTDSAALWTSSGTKPNWIQYTFDKAYMLDAKPTDGTTSRSPFRRRNGHCGSMGIREGSQALAAPQSMTLGDGLIGAWLGTDGVTVDRQFTGKIDDARFYNRALSQEEIASPAERTEPFAKPF